MTVVDEEPATCVGSRATLHWTCISRLPMKQFRGCACKQHLQTRMGCIAVQCMYMCREQGASAVVHDLGADLATELDPSLVVLLQAGN